MGIQRASLGNEAPRRSEKGRLHGFNFKRELLCLVGQYLEIMWIKEIFCIDTRHIIWGIKKYKQERGEDKQPS